MKLDQGDETEGVSGTGWLCCTRHPERILPDNTHFVEKNVGWILACHTQMYYAPEKCALRGTDQNFSGTSPMYIFGEKKKKS